MFPKWGDYIDRQATNSRQMERSMKLKERSPKILEFLNNYVHGFLKVSRGRIEGCMLFDVCNTKLWDKVRARVGYTVAVTGGKACHIVFAAEFHRQPSRWSSFSGGVVWCHVRL